MWPITVAELRNIIAPHARPATGALSDEVGAAELTRAISWRGPELGAGDVFFVVEMANHVVVRSALARGAVCVVTTTWSEAESLDPASRSRLFVGDNPLLAFRKLASFMRERFGFPVIAVGGSNGKTTTKDLIAHLLSAGGTYLVTETPGTNNGWVGTPITLCHPDHHASRENRAVVVEIGIDARGAMADHVRVARPDLAVLTAVGPEHLSGLGTHEDAVREELVLFEGAKRRVWLLDEPKLRARFATDGREGDLSVRAKDTPNPREDLPSLIYAWRATSEAEGALSVTFDGATRELRVPMPGAHNGRNAALAIAIALMSGEDLDGIAESLGTFHPPAQRCAVRDLATGITLIDDTYNASPSSLEAAFALLGSFDPRRERVVLLGDMLDLGSETARYHREVKDGLLRIGRAHVRLYGDAMSEIASLVDGPNILSVGRAARQDEPDVLFDLHAFEHAPVILIKGSRGMALERALYEVERRCSERSLRIGVLGPDAEGVALSLRSIPSTGVHLVHALHTEDLERGAAHVVPHDIVIIVGLARRAGMDVESDLAVMAQALVTLRRAAIFAPSSANDDEALELLRGVVPTSCEVRHASSTNINNVTRSVIDRCLDGGRSTTG